MNNEMAKELYEATIICRVLNLSGWDEEGPRDARGFVKYLRRRGLCRACFADNSLAEIWSAIVELYLEKEPIKEDSICKRLREKGRGNIENLVRELAICEYQDPDLEEHWEEVFSRRGGNDNSRA